MDERDGAHATSRQKSVESREHSVDREEYGQVSPSREPGGLESRLGKCPEWARELVR